MNRIDQLFSRKKQNILNIFITSGYPVLESTGEVLMALQSAGVDMAEVGIPYSDPIADGPVIQQSNMIALQNRISIKKIFEQLTLLKGSFQLPLILMGYLNPVMQYGIEKFCKDAQDAGVDGIILPDLPLREYKTEYEGYFKAHNLHFIFLITPETSKERILEIDKISTGFIYAVSASATTGYKTGNTTESFSWVKDLAAMKLINPVLVGFGIKDIASFKEACKYAHGAIIGSAFIKRLSEGNDVKGITHTFVHEILA